jgi:tRNA-dihydrouridine synthase B
MKEQRILTCMKIGTVHIGGRIVLAPLAGITDTSFRALCRRSGAALVFTEMISADGLVRGNTNTLRYLYFDQTERPLGIQLFGSDPDILSEGARLAVGQKPDLIDLNLACPVRKVVKRMAGAALLQNLKSIEHICHSVVQAVDIPVTIKIRSGWDSQSIVAVEVAQLAQQCGIAGITVHPRTQKEKFSGRADWEIISRVKEAVSIPVIGSGDVTSALDAKNMFEQTHCDAVMIGRASLGQPWIFQHINHYLETGEHLNRPTVQECFHIASRHLAAVVREKGEPLGVRIMRKHLIWYTKGMPGAAQLRQSIFRVETIRDVQDLVQQYMEGSRLEVAA